jgi:hypothetical protein
MKFKISSRCSGGGCVAVAVGAQVLVRDEKHPDGPVLEFTRPDWRAFLDDLRDGAFDGPQP